MFNRLKSSFFCLLQGGGKGAVGLQRTNPFYLSQQHRDHFYYLVRTGVSKLLRSDTEIGVRP